MQDLSENNLIRFTNISRKKGVIYANFRVRGLRNGVVLSASVSVDITAIDLDQGDSLEKIIEECSRHGLKEFKKAEFHFEGISDPKEVHSKIDTLASFKSS